MGRKPLTPEQQERRRARLKAWCEAHREKRRSYNKRWEQENRERVNEMQRKRYRARKESKRRAAEPAAD
jgi:hypothetical protein